MPTSDNTSIVIILGVILLLSLFYIFGSGPIHNEGNLQRNTEVNDTGNDNEDVYTDDSSMSTKTYASSEFESKDVVPDVDSVYVQGDDSTDSSIEIIKERSMGRNGPYYRRKHGNKYKSSSYNTLGAEKDFSKIDRQFRVRDVTKNETDKFVPMDDGDGEYAPINIKDIKGTEKNKFDSDGFLPKEKEKDWFETIETVSVKNRNLIQIHRPIGVNTIGSSHKGAIYDLRGLDDAIANKTVTGPWLQSSWEPDRSSKRLCS